MNKIISQLEFWLILFGFSAVPNWSWAVFGGAEESRMIVLGLTVGALALLEAVRTLTLSLSLQGRGDKQENALSLQEPAPYPETSSGQALIRGRGEGEGIGFGFFKNPLNWIISVPFFLVMADWARIVIPETSSGQALNLFQDLFQRPGSRNEFGMTGGGFGMTATTQFFGFDIPWQMAVLPVFLLLAWHFLLRRFFSVAASPFFSVIPTEESRAAGRRVEESLIQGSPRLRHPSSRCARLRGLARDDKTTLLKFAFAWIIIAALIALVRGFLSSPPSFDGAGLPLLGEERGPGNIGLWFVISSVLALALSALRLPLSAPSKSYRLGRLFYVPAAVLIVLIVFFLRFEIRVARAASAAARNDFAAARRLNPYYPEYTLSWAEAEIDNLGKADLTADITASKQKVGEIVKGLDLLPRPAIVSRSETKAPLYPDSATGSARYKGSLATLGPATGGSGKQDRGSGQQGGLLAMTIRIALAWENLGKFAEGANERALAIYDALIAASKDNADSSLIIKKALLLEKSGRANEAIEFLSPLTLTLSPQGGRGDKEQENTLSFSGRGGNQQGDALSFLEPAPYPETSSGQALIRGRGEGEGWRATEIRYHLGRLLYNSGKEDEARDIWLTIVADEPDYSDVNYSLGAYFARQKNYPEARRYWRKVLQLNPDNADIKKKIDELGRKR